MEKGSLYIGCSGYYYTEWKGSFYPEKTSSKDFLSLYSQKFNTVEINASFYRIPTEKSLLKWYDETPEDFKFFMKIPRTVSHIKRLKNSKEEILDFCLLVERTLKDKLAGFLYQFPPSFKNTEENLDLVVTNPDFNFLNVMEFRHESWWREEVFKALQEKNIVFSGVSFPGNLSEDFIINHPDVLYYRLHGKPVLYRSSYSKEFLNDLAEKIKASHRKSFIFFNNTDEGAAIRNALYLKEILEY